MATIATTTEIRMEVLSVLLMASSVVLNSLVLVVQLTYSLIWFVLESEQRSVA
jgi:hypothetical protein